MASFLLLKSLVIYTFDYYPVKTTFFFSSHIFVQNQALSNSWWRFLDVLQDTWAILREPTPTKQSKAKQTKNGINAREESWKYLADLCLWVVVAWGGAEHEAGHCTLLLTFVLGKHTNTSRYKPVLATITNRRTQRVRGCAVQTFEISSAVDVLWLCSYL